MKKIWISFLLIITLLFTGCGNGEIDVDKEIHETITFVDSIMQEQLTSGMEWTAIGLMQAGKLTDEQIAEYYASVETIVKEKKGILDERSYTEYSRTVLGLSILGFDPQNVAGYDLTKKLEEYNKVAIQGINGPMWALIALDSGNYGSQAIKEKYISFILDKQLDDGGWDFANTKADPDMTAMALCALAKHMDEAGVKEAVDKGLNTLSSLQKSNGCFESWGEESLESCAQTIIALTALGIDPTKDERFIKDKNLLEVLVSYRTEEGGFAHTVGAETNGMSTEQGLLALDAYKLFMTNQSGVYEGETK